MSITKRTQAGLAVIEPVLRTELDVVVDNMKQLYGESKSHCGNDDDGRKRVEGGLSNEIVEECDSIQLNKEERSLFYYDTKDIDWYELFEAHHLRFRRKLLRESDENLSDARQRMKR